MEVSGEQEKCLPWGSVETGYQELEVLEQMDMCCVSEEWAIKPLQLLANFCGSSQLWAGLVVA